MEFEEIKTPLSEQFRTCTRRFYSNGSVRVSPSNCVLPTRYQQFAERIKNFEVREDDVWVITYPKCGTTWTQEMVWLITHDVNIEMATKMDIDDRSPFLEFVSIAIPEEEGAFGIVNTPNTIEFAERLPSPRCIKSHLPKELLPDQLWTKTPKIVYVTRNVKDVLVSYYNHHRLMNGYTGSLEQFSEIFMTESIVFWDPFWKHVLDFWDMRNEPNILINSFEEMKEDLPATIKKTAKFLGKELSEEQMTILTKHLGFTSMKNNPKVNFENVQKRMNAFFLNNAIFMRRGEVGSGEKDLSPEIVARVDQWSMEHIQGTNYTFVG